MSLSGPESTPLDMIFGHTASLAHGNPFMAHRHRIYPARTLHKVADRSPGSSKSRCARGGSFDLWANRLQHPRRAAVKG